MGLGSYILLILISAGKPAPATAGRGFRQVYTAITALGALHEQA
jgi:hypothetical protein